MKPHIIHIVFSSFWTRELVHKSCIQKDKDTLFNECHIFGNDDRQKQYSKLITGSNTAARSGIANALNETQTLEVAQAVTE